MNYRQSSVAYIDSPPVLVLADDSFYTGALTTGDWILSKPNGTRVPLDAGADVTTGSGGGWAITFAVTDLALCGPHRLILHKEDYQSGPVGFDVISANVYDSLVAGTDQIDIKQQDVADALLLAPNGNAAEGSVVASLEALPTATPATPEDLWTYGTRSILAYDGTVPIIANVQQYLGTTAPSLVNGWFPADVQGWFGSTIDDLGVYGIGVNVLYWQNQPAPYMTSVDGACCMPATVKAWLGVTAPALSTIGQANTIVQALQSELYGLAAIKAELAGTYSLADDANSAAQSAKTTVDSLATICTETRAGYIDLLDGFNHALLATQASLEARTLASADYATALAVSALATTTTLSEMGAAFTDDINANFETVQTALDSLATICTETRGAYIDAAISTRAAPSDLSPLLIHTRGHVALPSVFERPATSSTVYRVEFCMYDASGAMDTPDAAPTIGVVNHGGTSRDANLSSGTMSLISTGLYRETYTVASDHALEELIFSISATKDAVARVYVASTIIREVETGITAAEVWEYETRNLTDKLDFAPTPGEIWNHAERTLTDKTGFAPSELDIWTYATREITDKTGFAPTAVQVRQEMDANSINLDVAVSSRLAEASYTAPDNSAIGTAASQATTAATQAGTAATQATAAAATGLEIKARTDLIPNSPAAIGSQMTLATGAITSTKFAAGAITEDALAASALAAIAVGTLDEEDGIEDGVTLRQAFQRMGAVIAGEVSGAGTGVETFIGLDGVTERVSIIVTSAGNRTAITYY